MPLTSFQSDVFKVISANRNPDSFAAGGIVINRDRDSARYSDDIDLFTIPPKLWRRVSMWMPGLSKRRGILFNSRGAN